MYRIVVDSGSGGTEEYSCARGEYVIGRHAQCDIFLPDATVSGRHARLLVHGDRLLIEDLGSTNGTFLDGRRIEGARELSEGTLDIGRFKVTISAAVTGPDSRADSALPGATPPPAHGPDREAEDLLEYTQEAPAQIDAVARISDAPRTAPDPAPRANRTPANGIVGEVTGSEPGLLDDLAVGATVEFSGERGTKRLLRLKSISGQRGVYFFGGENANDMPLSLTSVRLTECLRERSARVMSA